MNISWMKGSINNMENGKKRILLNGILKIILVFIIIGLNYLLVKHNQVIKDMSVKIIGGSDGPTSIYISSKYTPIYILIYSVSIFVIIDIIVLLIYDIIKIK